MIHDFIKFVFWGTPELSVEILEHLKQAGFLPALVVTNPDRSQGRKMLITPPPVKVWAIKNSIPFLQPENLSDPVFLGQMSNVKCQLFIIVAYGKIIPKVILDIPTKGSLNIHYSLLPKYRGASPIESVILNDDQNTGVSILLLDEKMDHGPIVARSALQITNNNNQIPNNAEIQNSNIQTPTQLEYPPRASQLRKAMNKLAGELLVKTIPRFVASEIKLKEQNHSQATYCKKFAKADGEINLADDPYKNYLKIRAFDDSIGTHFFATKKGKKVRIIIKDAEFRHGKLIITRIVPEGKKEISYEKFLKWVR